MMSFFNKQPRRLKMRAPNGGEYTYYSWNTIGGMNDETFQSIIGELEEANKAQDQEAFDKAWSKLQESEGTFPEMEQEFKRLQSEMGQIFEKTQSFFQNSLLNNIPSKEDFFGRMRKGNNYDDKIKYHEEAIERLKEMKEREENKVSIEELKQEMVELDRKINEKLDELGDNLENEERKTEITKELASIRQKSKEIENKIKDSQ